MPTTTRFFARVTGAHLECPHCGTVHSFGNGRSKRGNPGTWDPRLCRFTCHHCQRSVVIGLCAWSLRTGKIQRARPADQIPDPRQAAELRRLVGGFWLSEDDSEDPETSGRRGDRYTLPTNLKEPCTHGPGCPLHGDDPCDDPDDLEEG